MVSVEINNNTKVVYLIDMILIIREGNLTV